MIAKPHATVMCSLILSLLVSACGSGQRIEPTMTPHPVGSLSDSYQVALAVAQSTLGQAKNSYAIPQQVTSSYDVSNSQPKWSRAFFFFVTYDGSNHGGLEIGVTTTGEVTQVKYEGQVPFPSSIESYVIGGAAEEAALRLAWKNLGAKYDVACGPVTKITYNLRLLRNSILTEADVPLFVITYNDTASITIGLDAFGVQKVLGIDNPCSSAVEINPNATLTITDTPAPPIEYIVQPGDTCDSIAYLHGITRKDLIAQNNFAPENCDQQLQVNQKLIIAKSFPTSTPIIELTATPTPELVVEPYVTTSQALFVRNGPGTKFDVVGEIAIGRRYAVIGTSDAWWQIALDDHQIGWVFAPGVEFVGDAQAVPTVSSPPTPVPTP